MDRGSRPGATRTIPSGTGPVFRRIDIRRRGLEVAEQILKAIHEGSLLVGDRLPSERELADQTGVSRPSVREGLSALQLMGFLETRAGDGTFVAVGARDLAALSTVLADLQGDVGLLEALETRRILEKAVAQAVIARRGHDVGGLLRAPLDALREAAAARDFPAYSEANAQFHAALATATGNSVLERALVPLINVMLGGLARGLRRRKYDTDPAFFDSSVEAHRAMYDALVSGDRRRISAAIDAHYDQIERSLA